MPIGADSIRYTCFKDPELHVSRSICAGKSLELPDEWVIGVENVLQLSQQCRVQVRKDSPSILQLIVAYVQLSKLRVMVLQG